MKQLQNIFMCICAVITMNMHADLKSDLMTLNHDLMILEQALKQLPKTGGPFPPAPPPPPSTHEKFPPIHLAPEAPEGLQPLALQSDIDNIAEAYQRIEKQMAVFDGQLQTFLNVADQIAKGKKSVKRNEEIPEFEELINARKKLDALIMEFERSLQKISAGKSMATNENSIEDVGNFLQRIRHHFKVFAATNRKLIQKHSDSLRRIIFTHDKKENAGWAHIDKIWHEGAIKELKPRYHRLKAGGWTQGGGRPTFADRFKEIMKKWQSGSQTTPSLPKPSPTPEITEPTHEEQEAAKKADEIFALLKKKIDERVVPALNNFINDIKSGVFNQKNYDQLKNVLVGVVYGNMSHYALNLSEQLGKIKNINILSRQEIEDMLDSITKVTQLIEDQPNNIKSLTLYPSQRDNFLKSLNELINSNDYQVIKTLEDQLEDIFNKFPGRELHHETAEEREERLKKLPGLES